MIPSSDQETHPFKPLKILTLDGGGLQAISTLLTLDKLLGAIAAENRTSTKPRPCDVFDCIAGIGAGGWLAILLGRFRMDVPSCLSEWYTITECITPKSKGKELRMRLLHHSYFNTDRLVEQVDQLTKIYGTGDCLFENDPTGARTRHVFVAALRSDAKDYNLFRTYQILDSAKSQKKLREGPEDPLTFKISHAFAVTGAARYFTPPWKEQMATSGRIGFSDTKFPKPHNITELALDEMWAIYGCNVPLSVVVNLGPGQAHEKDIKSIVRRFSWGLDNTALHTQTSHSSENLSKPEERTFNDQATLHISRAENIKNDFKGSPKQCSNNFAVKFSTGGPKRSSASHPAKESEPKGQTPRIDTFGSIKGRRLDAKLRRQETEVREDIKKKLRKHYPDERQLYFRIAPDTAPRGTSQNDNSAPGIVLNATSSFLDQPKVGRFITEIAKRVPQVPPIASMMAGTA